MILSVLAVSLALFREPPRAYAPHVWWHWMNGNVTREGITADLEAMAEIGLGGAQFFDAGCSVPRGPLAFNTPEWFDTVEHAVREAKRLGLELGQSNCSGWSSSGGPWITPENSMKKLVFTETNVTAGAKGLWLPQPETQLGFYRDVRVLAFPAGKPPAPIAARETARSKYSITLETDEPREIEGFSYRIGLKWEWCAWSRMTVEASADGRTFEKVEEFPFVITEAGRFDLSLRYHALPRKRRVKAMRFTMTAPWQESPHLAEVRFESVPRVAEVAAKTFEIRNTLFRTDIPEGLSAEGAVARDSIIDLTDRMSADGTLDWTVPAGEWTVLRIGTTTTGSKTCSASETGAGLECDKLSAKGIDAHFDAYLKPLLEGLGPLAGKDRTFTNLLIDSFEVGAGNWTWGLDEAFERRFGYSLVPYLVAWTGRAVGSLAETEKALADFRRLVSDLFCENYIGRLAARAHAYGVEIAVEPYGNGTFDDFDYGRRGDIVMGETWTGRDGFKCGAGNARFPASVAHVCGQRIVGMETFTAGFGNDGWSIHPYHLKAQADRVYAAGVNRIYYHRFTHQPWTDPKYAPGMTMGPWGMHFDRTQTWWPLAKDWVRYQTRVQYLLQQGAFVGDALFVTDGTCPIGGEKDDSMRALGELPSGYSYNWCSANMEKELRLAADGTVTTPCGSVFQRLLRSGDGVAALKGLAPDFDCEGSVRDIASHIHRRYSDGTDGYFVAFANRRAMSVEASFRQTGRAPEIWDAETGTAFRPARWGERDGRTFVTLNLRPSGSCFVMFRDRATEGLAAEPVRKTVSESDLPAKWTLEINGERRTLERLVSWTELDGFDVRHFAGTATYRAEVPLVRNAGARTILSLGEVCNFAEVTVNGKAFPVLWRPPFELDITEALSPTSSLISHPSSLVIKITNLWPNRLIGNEELPDDCEWTPAGGRGFALAAIPDWVRRGERSPTGRTGFTTWKHWKKGDGLLPSGLLGPVGFRIEREVGTSASPVGEESVWLSVKDAPVYDGAVVDGTARAAEGTSWFVSVVTNADTVVSAKWTTAGLGVYEVYVNGKPVGEDFLKPGFTHNAKTKYAFTYDVTRLLERGAGGVNTFAAEVSSGWWRDKICSPSRKTGGFFGRKSAFRGVLELTFADGTKRRLGTNTRDWHAGVAGPVVQAGIFDGETYDARMKPGFERPDALKEPEVNDEFRGEILPTGGAEVCLRRDLAMDPVEAYVWKDVTGADGTKAYGTVVKERRYAAGETMRIGPGEDLVVDFGQNAAAVPCFRFRGDSGTVLTARPAEMLNDGNGARSRGNDGPEGSVYRVNLRSGHGDGRLVRYTFAGRGTETYCPRFAFFGYRYVSVRATAPVEIESVRSVPVTSIRKDLELGSVETGSAAVNRLIANIRWGQLSNYLSVPTDCPQRDERLGWLADTQVFCEAGTFNADTRGFFRKWMRDVRDTQLPQGGFPGVAPFAQYGSMSGMRLGWSDAGVIVPYQIWKQFGDRTIVDENWAAMERFMARVAETKYRTADLPEACDYQWNDWLSLTKYESCPFKPEYDAFDGNRRPKPETLLYWNYLGGCYWLWDARMMAAMAEATGRIEAVSRCRRMADEAKAYLKSKFFGGDDGLLLPVFRGMQTPALFALKLGLVEGAAREATIAELRQSIADNGGTLHTGFLGTSIAMDTLTEIGMTDIAYSLLFNRRFPGWLYSVDQGATTIWERWNSYTRETGFGPVDMNSFNHYAYGSVLAWIYKTAAGIAADPKAPGFRNVIMAPKPDRRLGFVKASYRSAAGLIESAWRYEGKEWLWEFSIPEGVTADVTVPGENQVRRYTAGRHEIRK